MNESEAAKEIYKLHKELEMMQAIIAMYGNSLLSAPFISIVQISDPELGNARLNEISGFEMFFNCWVTRHNGQNYNYKPRIWCDTKAYFKTSGVSLNDFRLITALVNK